MVWIFYKAFLISLFSFSALCSFAQHTDTAFNLKGGDFALRFNQKGISSLQKGAGDPYPTNYIEKGKSFGAFTIRYKAANSADWQTVNSRSTLAMHKLPGNQGVLYNTAKANADGLKLSANFKTGISGLNYTVKISNTGKTAIRIGDLAFPLFYNTPSGENEQQIFEGHVIKHSFISGDGSYMFFERPTGLGPYLVMTPMPGTHLEYFDLSKIDSDEVYHAYIYSEAAAERVKGIWRQPQTGFTLAPGATATYGFNFSWARDYADVKTVLYNQGLPDINIIPGMTIPNDLYAMFSIRSKQKIDEIAAEFPAETEITYLGKKEGDLSLYKVKFAHPGENKLTVNYGGKYKTYLEFFSTQPLSILYQKRAAFLVNHQQHRDSTKWYNGVFSQWDMSNKVLRGPDNTDGFDGWWGYVLTCDDPGLCKAPFLAAKNLHYPDQKEIDALEYYIKNFVWGKLQRTDKLTYPYGIYGTPNWYIDSDPERRKNYTQTNLDKEHIWRSYDYPHIMMLYYHMYQIASLYPNKTHYLDKKGYLIRAMETAKAYFTYPYQILPWYETYKWGCYNELLLTDLMATLRKEGYASDAEWLRKEWEKKVKYFVYDDKYPYRSEYSIDATAFESSHAFAKYAMQNEMKPDTELWFDKKLNCWYSHPVITAKAAATFMEKQIQANIACRGWLENAYYLKGSDFRGSSDHYLLSYMADMGGWAITDYALNYAKDPEKYLQLGYASYLSSFALMNTGTAKSNYGYWYPGVENDGASGWAFEPLKHTTTWIRKEQDRGSWFYDGEIDLGYGGAMRTAATIVTRDAVFGLFAYGGIVTFAGDMYSVDPKDGLQQRLYYVDKTAKFNVVLDRDGFADKPGSVQFNSTFTKLSLTIENRTHDAHNTNLSLSGLTPGNYAVLLNGKHLKDLMIANGLIDVILPVNEGDYFVELEKR